MKEDSRPFFLLPYVAIERFSEPGVDSYFGIDMRQSVEDWIIGIKDLERGGEITTAIWQRVGWRN